MVINKTRYVGHDDNWSIKIKNIVDEKNPGTILKRMNVFLALVFNQSIELEQHK